VRDAELLDMSDELGPIIAHWERMLETLTADWESPNGTDAPLLVGAIGLGLDFEIWRTTVRQQGLSDEQAVELMTKMVRCVTRALQPSPHLYSSTAWKRSTPRSV
jgi:hypothetical protein